MKIYKDRHCFLRYTSASMFIFILMCLMLIAVKGFPTQFTFVFTDFWWVPVGGYLGILSCLLIHNASHNSLRPRWLNRPVGELCAAFQLYGFFGWKVAHLIHHAFPDDPVRDPHPPGKMSFWRYVLEMRSSLVRVTDFFYFEQFGTTPEVYAIVKREAALRTVTILLRILFWYLLLGPALFVALFIPAYLTIFFFFTHFNYFTHRMRPDGVVEILDIDEGLYYKMMNRIGFGTYFHKSHHLRPNLFNPRYLRKSSAN